MGGQRNVTPCTSVARSSATMFLVLDLGHLSWHSCHLMSDEFSSGLASYVLDGTLYGGSGLVSSGS